MYKCDCAGKINGITARLLSNADYKSREPLLPSREIYWTDHTWRNDVDFFIADVGISYITSCFIPISLEKKVLFIDQTYSGVSDFFNIRPEINLEDETFVLSLPESGEHIEGPAVLIGGTPEGNWYHWVINWLPRLALCLRLRPELIYDPNVRFIFHNNAKTEPYRSTIEMFGLNPQQMLFIDPEMGFTCESLYVPTMGDQNYYFPEYHKLCRDTLRRQSSNKDGTVWPQKFFISREGIIGAKRKIVNFVEFEKELVSLGISIVALESFSGVEQIRLFGQAELIVGVHGAGLGNILFCNAGCRVVLLDNERNIWGGLAGMFSCLAKVLDIRMTLLMVEEVEVEGVDYSEFSRLHNRDVVVDIGLFRKAVEREEGNVSDALLTRKDRRTMTVSLTDLNQYITETETLLSAIYPFMGLSPRGFDTNFLGVKTGFHLMSHWYPEDGIAYGMANDRHITTELPNPKWGEPFFEYGSMVRAIREGGDCIIIVELGGGYAARSCDMAAMSHMLKKTSKSLVVEPVPRYVEWAKAHFVANELSHDDHIVLPVAVTAVSRPIVMNTEAGGFGNEVARINTDIADSVVQVKDLISSDRISLGGSKTLQLVNGLTISVILSLYCYVDLLDIDVQHLEYDILAPSWDVVNSKVARLHIGTHTVDLHERLKLDLLRNDWLIEVDLLPFSSTKCYNGPSKINDGILAAKNRRLRLKSDRDAGQI